MTQDLPLYCTVPAPNGAVRCRFCSRIIPVIPKEDGSGSILAAHPCGPSGKMLCPLGGKEADPADIKRAYWIDDLPPLDTSYFDSLGVKLKT